MPISNDRRPFARRLAPLALFCLAAGASAPAAAGAQQQGQQQTRQQPPQRQQATLEELAAYATPAVVLIDVTTVSDTRQGSGFLVDASGRIVTNYHVIRDARSARVKLSNGDVYEEVEVLAEDERRDLAVLQVAGFQLPSLPMGNSDSVRIGSPVVLIGSPLGLANTVSTGIVSGRRQEDEGYQLLQVTAPASPGSSGGPVLSIDGSVVGVASWQFQAGQNLNFAVPINYVRGMLEHLGREPIAVLRPNERPSRRGAMTSGTGAAEVVNQGIEFSVADFHGYELETRTVLGPQRERRTRITYQLIEPVGAGEPQIERFMESETTERGGPFGTVQITARERSRVVVRLHGLEPVSARGSNTWWIDDEGWATATYDLRFEDGLVQGKIEDSSEGHSVDIDRSVPAGVILHDIRNLAFGLLQADQLVGRSLELTTFDPRSAEIRHDRMDVRADTTVQAAGESYDALRVSLASGLSNQLLYFRRDRPRLFLRRVDPDEGELEEVLSMRIFAREEG